MRNKLFTDKSTRLFIILAGFFVTNALIAEVIGTKIFSLESSLGIEPLQLRFFGETFSFNLTAGVLLWPVVFVMTDLINEYYGPKGVRFLSFLTIGLIAFSFIIFFVATRLTPAGFWATGTYRGVPDSNAAFAGIFGQSQAIIVASLIAFLIAQLLDVFIFHRIKKATGEKGIWLRATGSTLVSQFVDSFVVLFIAFYVAPRLAGAEKPWSFALVMAICIGNYIYKFLVALLLTPVIYLAHRWIESYLGQPLSTELKREAMGEAVA